MKIIDLPEIHFKHWTSIDTQLLNRAESFDDCRKIARRILDCYETPAHIVCGMISPLPGQQPEQREANLRTMQRVNEDLILKGRPIFSYLMFQDTFSRLIAEWKVGKDPQEYCWPLIMNFHAPLYWSGKIERAYFLPGSNQSRGSRWEKQMFPYFGIDAEDLSQAYVDAVLASPALKSRREMPIVSDVDRVLSIVPRLDQAA